jgi:hypothetical protein
MVKRKVQPCKVRRLKETDVEFRIKVEQDEIEVRGNALASGDDAIDKAAEDEILARLDNGDVWAWAGVTVEAHLIAPPCPGTVSPTVRLVGRDFLGCCNYTDENDFKQQGGYYDDMKAQALADLQGQIDYLVTVVCK